MALMEEDAVKKKMDRRHQGRMTLANGHLDGGQEFLEVRYTEAVTRRSVIERDRARGVMVRRLGWPAAMLALMALTGKENKKEGETFSGQTCNFYVCVEQFFF